MTDPCDGLLSCLLPHLLIQYNYYNRLFSYSSSSLFFHSSVIHFSFKVPPLLFCSTASFLSCLFHISSANLSFKASLVFFFNHTLLPDHSFTVAPQSISLISLHYSQHFAQCSALMICACTLLNFLGNLSSLINIIYPFGFEVKIPFFKQFRNIVWRFESM